jgi:Tol biopolymer transport system component
VTLGLEQYLSVAASADGRRLVATVANPTASLWSVPILDRVAEDRDVKPFPVSTVRALTPRFGGTGLFYLSSRGTGDGLWRFQDGQALEVWNGGHGGLFEPPAVSADGRRVALILRRNGKRRLHVVTADGAEVQPLAESFDVQGTAAWSPDGRWIAACGNDGSGPGLFKIPTSGGAPVRLRTDTLTNPVWSPDGELIVYEGPASSGKSPLLAMRPDGTRVELPEIRVQVQGERARFVPDGRALVYMLGPFHDFWWLDLATQKTRRLTSFRSTDAVRTFDITPDGKHIVFDRLRENSDIVLIDLPR